MSIALIAVRHWIGVMKMNRAQATAIVMNIERSTYSDEAKFEACKSVSQVIPSSNSILRKSDYYHALKWLAEHTELKK